MGARSQIARWGAGLAVRIPEPIAEQWGVQEGSEIEIVSHGDHVVLRKISHSLAEMLSRVTEDNLHPALDTGASQGNEEW